MNRCPEWTLPRISDSRSPAEPSSVGQKDRYRRILGAAKKLGTTQEFERVQMQDVASESEVAIATLYRYFPSKVHLFVGVMRAELEAVDRSQFALEPGRDRAGFTADMLLEFTRRLSRNRMLSMSMLQAMILSGSVESPRATQVDNLFLDLLLATAGWGKEATEDQRRRCWLVIQCWFGVLVTTLSEESPVAAAEVDIRRACELLLGEATPDLGERDPLG